MKYLLLIYSKKERWGILSLVLLNLVLILISFSYKHPSFEFTEASVIAFQTPKDLNLNKGFATRHTKTDSLFPFNPNEASKADLIALGFSERVTKNIVTYRSKGGQFYNTNSLKKIYGMDSLETTENVLEKLAQTLLDIDPELQLQEIKGEKSNLN